ncbi:hypothetical protein ACH4D5_13195 [Streptomyces sp. NPDC018029]|uniref:hypothetical protein n=1 Tax=Streptomyces sp. NPDC018029 TaxID=3365032 RepID=UPI0037B994A6
MNESETPVGDVAASYDGLTDATDAYVPPPGPVQIDDPLVAADDEGMDPSETLPPPLDG